MKKYGISHKVATPYHPQTSLFFMVINFPNEYPFKPPHLCFTTRIYNPNITPNGKICGHSLPILGKEYSAALSIFDIFEKIYSLFTDPISDSAYGLGNSGAARLYREDRESFNAIAKEWTKRYA